MIGRIEGDGQWAEMDDEGDWTSSSQFVASYLSLMHNLQGYSPADGAPGRRQLHEAARDLDWQVTRMEELPAVDMGDVDDGDVLTY